MITKQEWHKELKKRRKKIWQIAQEAEVDLVLVYGGLDHAEPFRYLTNFVPQLGNMWGVLSAENEMSCYLNFHWALREAQQVSGVEDWQGMFNPIPLVINKLKEKRPKKVGVLGLKYLPWHVYFKIIALNKKMEILDLDQDFELIRRIKSKLEISLLKEAARVTEQAFADVRENAKLGTNENEITARVQYVFSQKGAGQSFDPLVMAGTDKNTAVIARQPRARAIESGDTLMIDIGAEVQGYQADIARTFVFGRPSALQQKVWDTVRKAHDAVVEMAKPGLPCNQLHTTAEKIINEAGYTLDHRIGHGVGLATSFEWPSLDTETEILRPGMTFAVEPGIYVPGAGAIKLENMILVTQNGCEILSNGPSNLSIL